MIHFTCDGCGRVIDHEDETRYVVRVEVYAAIDDDTSESVDEADHLEEIEELLEKIEDYDTPDETLYKQARYDLCEQCRERFVNNPLGRGAARLGYSQN